MKMPGFSYSRLRRPRVKHRSSISSSRTGLTSLSDGDSDCSSSMSVETDRSLSYASEDAENFSFCDRVSALTCAKETTRKAKSSLHSDNDVEINC